MLINIIKVVITVTVILVAGLLLAGVCHAASTSTFLSLGAYYRDCEFLTDPMICDNDKMGSNMPGTIDFGFRTRGLGWYGLKASQVDIMWHHQSYINRGGFLFHDFGGTEAPMDMFGVRATWEWNQFSW